MLEKGCQGRVVKGWEDVREGGTGVSFKRDDYKGKGRQAGRQEGWNQRIKGGRIVTIAAVKSLKRVCGREGKQAYYGR